MIGSSAGEGELDMPAGRLSALRALAGGPARVALLYAAVSATWILVSDRAVALLGLSPSQMLVAGTLKGWLFVALTTALLYRLTRDMVREAGAAQGQIARQQRQHIAERTRAEAALREKNALLAQSNADLEQFAHIAAHDLREPLRMISTYVALLERRYGAALDADAHAFIGFAREGAQRLDCMVLDLLDFAHAGQPEQDMAPVAFAEVAEAVRHSMAERIVEAGASLSLPKALPVVLGSKGDLVLLLGHLVDNAIRFRHPDRPPKVTLACEPGRGEWVFSVADNGIGIEADYFEKIFVIFQRLHPRDGGEGTGIGLALCRRIVLRHGGRIWLDSIPGLGSTFRFTLPTPAGG